MKWKKIVIPSLVFMAVAVNSQPIYLEPWERDYHTQFDDIRIQVIAHGLLAPNAHNIQPWKIRLNNTDEFTFELFVDSARLLPATDPPARQITISHGTFLELVSIAAEELGHQAEIQLFPSGEYEVENMAIVMDRKPVARVTLHPNGQSKKHTLYSEIFERVTNRSAYYGDPPTAEEKAKLLSLNQNPGFKLVFFEDAESLEKIRFLTIHGVITEATTEYTIKESQDVFRDSEKEKEEHRDGITMMSGGLKGIKLWFVEFFSNRFPISLEKFGEYWIKNETVNINSAPAFAMIISDGNSRTTQVETGMLFARFQLKASQMGFSVHPLSQVLQEFPEMSELYQDVHQSFARDGRTIQMLVRMGRAKDVYHSPRRDATDLIVRNNND